ncbi:MAG: type II toxin-antitoxin system PemK/MazF family toxin [Gemmatimonas sp.]
MLIVQSDTFNRSRIATVTVVALMGNIRLLDAPGTVLLPAKASGLPRDSVVNVSQLVTVHRDVLTERIRPLAAALLKQVDEGLRFALDL